MKTLLYIILIGAFIVFNKNVNAQNNSIGTYYAKDNIFDKNGFEIIDKSEDYSTIGLGLSCKFYNYMSIRYKFYDTNGRFSQSPLMSDSERVEMNETIN